MTIASILADKGGEVVTITAAHTVKDALALLAERRIGAVPVMDGTEVAGIFSERDVIHGLAENGAAALDRSVGSAMTSPAISVAREESVLGALALMTRRRIRHLPVVDGGRLVGFVSIGDLVKYRIDKIEADAEAMRSYIQAV
jgi:CBS domain-containing protein